MRCKKRATTGSLAAALQHCYRKCEIPNADRKQISNNKQHVFQSFSETMVKTRYLLSKKQRKDVVFGRLNTSDKHPEWMNNCSSRAAKKVL